MKVLLFEPRFWQAIATGAKVHTIRRTRKRPIKPGDALSLRGWEGAAYRSKQKTLRDETCLAVREIHIDFEGIEIDRYYIEWPDDLDAFARSDGFANWNEMRTYRNFHYDLPFSGELIQWGVHPMLKHLVK